MLNFSSSCQYFPSNLRFLWPYVFKSLVWLGRSVVQMTSPRLEISGFLALHRLCIDIVFNLILQVV